MKDYTKFKMQIVKGKLDERNALELAVVLRHSVDVLPIDGETNLIDLESFQFMYENLGITEDYLKELTDICCEYRDKVCALSMKVIKDNIKNQ